MNDFLSFYEEAKNKDLFIILGSQGSGTNLISRCLMNVFDFSVIRDLSLIFNCAIEVYKNPSEEIIQQELQYVLKRFFPGNFRKRLQKHYHHRTKYYQGIQDYVDQVNIKTAMDFAYFFYAYHTFTNGATYFAIKSDDIWENIEYISRIFPNRKYIFNTRDPRDNVLSIINKYFGPKHIYTASLYVKERINIFYEEILRNQEKAMILKYETLLTDPVDIIYKFSEKFNIKVPEDVEDRVKLLNIRPKNFNKWRKEMSEEELLVCETILYDGLINCGYDVVNNTPVDISETERLRYKFQDFRARIPQKLNRTFMKLYKA